MQERERKIQNALQIEVSGRKDVWVFLCFCFFYPKISEWKAVQTERTREERWEDGQWMWSCGCPGETNEAPRWVNTQHLFKIQKINYEFCILEHYAHPFTKGQTGCKYFRGHFSSLGGKKKILFHFLWCNGAMPRFGFLSQNKPQSKKYFHHNKQSKLTKNVKK